MPIIRVTRKQIQAANKAREAALKKDDDFSTTRGAAPALPGGRQSARSGLAQGTQSCGGLQGGAMSCLDATFTLTPRSPYYYNSLHNYAWLFCFGADFDPWSPNDLSSLYASDRFFFNISTAADPNLDYAQWAN
jgi:hypothetical protein